MLAYNDPALEKTIVHTNASGEGLGAALLQEHPDGVGSQKLTDVEQRYPPLNWNAWRWFGQHKSSAPSSMGDTSQLSPTTQHLLGGRQRKI